MFRLYGHWVPLFLEKNVDASFVYKLEYRHALGTPIAPEQLGPDAGYQGLTSFAYSDGGFLPSNLYWHHALFDNRLAFVIGITDTADYVDVYALVNPWTEFSNISFLNGPTIPSPSQGFAVALRWSITPNIHELGGLADPNADPSQPSRTFENFFTTSTQFRHFEAGWAGSWDQHLSITPLLQMLIDPAQDPDAGTIWALGLRMRAAF